MAVTIAKAKPVNITAGTTRQTAAPANNQSYNVSLGAGRVNQTPGGTVTIAGSGGGGVVQGDRTFADGASVTQGAPAGPSRAQIDPLLASLGSLDTILSNRNQQSRDEFGRAISGYDAQDALDRANYEKNVRQNEETLTSNNQRALLNAANGGSGLRGVLASLGGLAGSGADVVRRLVGLAANSDMGVGRETFETNAENLSSGWSNAEQVQRQRRRDAEATLDNNLKNNESGVLTSRQGIFQQLANAFGDTGEGRTYASQASALAAPIAATTRANIAPYQAASSSFSPAALQSYLGGTQNLEVATPTGGNSATPVNSPLFSSGRKKDQLAGVA